VKPPKRLIVIAVCALTALGVSVGLAIASESPPVPVVVETNPPPYTPPAGPAMSPAAAVQAAVRLASNYGDSRPTDLTQLRGTFAHNQAIMSPQAHEPESAETEAILRSDTYLTVMHGQFTSQLVPPGGEPAHGTVMGVITEAHTGEVEATYIGPTTPTAAGLGPVPIDEESGQATISSVGGKRGLIVGRLVQSTSPPPGYKGTTRALVGWHVLIGRGRLVEDESAAGPKFYVVARVTTGADGRFTVHTKPGRYAVAGVWAHGFPSAGAVCNPSKVTVRAGARVHVTVGCNGV
jgi:hypothetical protein